METGSEIEYNKSAACMVVVDSCVRKIEVE